MIQAYLEQETQKIHETFPQDFASLEHWKGLRDRYRQEYFYMLGLPPEPVKSPLQATITGTLKGDGYVVDMLHYQSMPKLYVTGNLYRPAQVEPGQRLPAVLYVCGHSNCGRNGNKAAYQSHGDLVRPAWVRLPGARHAATGRNRGDSSRHVSRGPLVVALARLHAGGRRVPQRHARDRLSD